MLLLQKPAAADDGKELEEAISRSSDMMKKIDVGEAMAMETEKLQLTPSQYKPAKYQYSKDEDTVLMPSDKEKLDMEEVCFDAYHRQAEIWCRSSFERMSKSLLIY
jgi:hypothetical protein